MSDTTGTPIIKTVDTDTTPQMIGSLPELQYLVLDSMREYLSDADVQSSYYGTRFTLKMRNGQTAEITIDVSSEDKKTANS